MKITLTQEVKQGIILTPQMKQALYVLQMPLEELRTYIEKQLEENFVLEEEQHLKEEITKEEVEVKEITNLIKNQRNNTSEYSLGHTQEELEGKQRYKESLFIKETTLQEHLLNTLRWFSLPPKQFKIGEFIIGNIDEDGYLNLSVEEIAQRLKVKKEEVENILFLIQRFEPKGVGARSLKEALFIQLKEKEGKLSSKKVNLVYKIIDRYLLELAKGKMKQIAYHLRVTLEEIKEAAKIISSLEPKPGRKFGKVERKFISPDVTLEKKKDGYEIIVNNERLPRIKVNSYYVGLLNQNHISKETKEYIREKLKSALHLIKTIQLRNKSLKELVEYIVEKQKDFFATGEKIYFIPLTIKKAAKELGKNESTISRIVNKKYINTPYGIFKLREFFTTSLNTGGNILSNEVIKIQIKEIVDKENPNKPLSDEEILQYFHRKGINIARRTIAKYRKQLNIPPSYRRKK